MGTTGPAIEQIEAAVAICQTCVVRDDCLQYALETNQESGVWGVTPKTTGDASASAGSPKDVVRPQSDKNSVT